MKATQELTDFVDEIVNDAVSMINSGHQDSSGKHWVDQRSMSVVLGKAQLMLLKLGPYGRA
jgi:hypothetical protein